MLWWGRDRLLSTSCTHCLKMKVFRWKNVVLGVSGGPWEPCVSMSSPAVVQGVDLGFPWLQKEELQVSRPGCPAGLGAGLEGDPGCRVTRDGP